MERPHHEDVVHERDQPEQGQWTADGSLAARRRIGRGDETMLGVEAPVNGGIAVRGRFDGGRSGTFDRS